MYLTSEVIIQNNIDSIEPLIEYVKVIASQLQLNNKEQHRLCYALEESLQNSISFDFEDDEIEEISIEISRVASGLKLTISDNGIPKNPFTKTPKTLEEIASDVSFETIAENDGDQIGAISDFVIRKLLDRYTYINRGKEGRSIEMLMYASQHKFSEENDPHENQNQLDNGKFSTIRSPLHDDITAISRLFYKTYGYTYVNDIVYYPERLAQAITKKQLINAIAVSDTDKIIGHIALMKPFEGAEITEWGMAISDPNFRGQGIMTKLIENIKDQAISSHFKGIFSHSVTNHEFTQKICTAHGFSDIALLVGYAGSKLSFKKITNELSQRESTIISYKVLDLSFDEEIFLPPQHREIINKLYHGIGINIVEKQVPLESTIASGTLTSRTRLTDIMIPAINIAEIILDSVGEDILEALHFITKKFSINKVDIIYLLIDLEDYEAVNRVKDFEDLGYIFAGIFPHYHNNNTLILQYINNIKFDYTLINSHTSLAKELKKYVLSLDPNQIGD